MTKVVRPKGGRGKRSYYSSHVRRIPEPVLDAVDALVDEFYLELQRAEELPVSGQWWEVLGVPQDAPRDEVKGAYRKLVRMFHPDVNGAPGAKKRFQVVRGAYESYISD